MSNPFFKFKQFTIWHDQCAMKVGTDGVLLGAWTPASKCTQILDVGTGSGLIALQLAQRVPLAQITAIEIDKVAAAQASKNIADSPWNERVRVECCDFKTFQSEYKYDLIVSNPPYFIDSLRCPDEQRSAARHTGGLNYDLLFRRSSQLLSESGHLCIIIPSEAEKAVIDAAWNHKLHPLHRLQVFTKPGKPCRRILFSFGSYENKCIEEKIYIKLSNNEFSPEYIALTSDFYLKM